MLLDFAGRQEERVARLTRRPRLRLLLESLAEGKTTAAEVRAEIERGVPVALDLEEVDLVDVEAVRFLNACRSKGIRMLNCSAYIREWMSRERRNLDAPRPHRQEEKE